MSKLMIVLGLFCLVLAVSTDPIPERDDAVPENIADATNLPSFITPVDFNKLKHQPCTEESLNIFAERYAQVYKNIDELSEEQMSDLLDPIELTDVKSKCGDEFSAKVDALTEEQEAEDE